MYTNKLYMTQDNTSSETDVPQPNHLKTDLWAAASETLSVSYTWSPGQQMTAEVSVNEAMTEWVSEQFLNGTSAQYRLYSK